MNIYRVSLLKCEVRKMFFNLSKFWSCFMGCSGFTFAEVNSVRASSSKVVCCHFSSDGKLLVSGGHDKKVRVMIGDR